MHRRLFAAISLVILLGTAAPAFSAPKRTSGDPSFLGQIILQLKKIFLPTALDLNDPLPPKP